MTRHSSSRGQAVSLDLLVAFLIFSVALLVFVANFEDLYQPDAPQYEGALASARRAAVAVAYSPGVPRNWTRSSFTLPGIAGFAGGVSEPRLAELLETNSSNLSDALGVGGYRLFFNLSLNDSSVARAGGVQFRRIAYTRAGSGEGEAADHGFRNYLLAEGVPFTEYAGSGNVQDFIDLLNGINAYDTVVVEGAGVNSSQLSAGQQMALQQWVANGGNYIQKREGTIIELLNSTQSYAPQGRVTAPAGLMKNASVNDAVTCASSVSVTNSSGVNDFSSLVNSTTGASLFASWRYGNGRVFFACGTIGSVSGSVPQSDLMAVNNFFGKRAEWGEPTTNASVSVPFSVPVSYRGLPAALQVVAWSD